MININLMEPASCYATISFLSLLSLVLLHVVYLLQDVFGADEAGRQRREVYVSLHRPFYVGGCRTKKQDHWGKFNKKPGISLL